MSLPLSPPVFAILAGLVEDRTGMHHDLDQLQLFADKVSPRALEAGFESLLDYYYFLRYDARGEAELQALMEHLVVQETYFYREADQLNALVSSVVAPRVARGERVRLWCAASSTGEEPLTLAMMLADKAMLDRVEIVASDISARALGRARSGGPYGARSRRSLATSPWFEEREGQTFVKRRLVDAVRWERINVVDTLAVAALGVFDVILCRNLLIYFREEIARRVVETLAGSLAEGGTLVVGVSESLLRFGTSLRCEERAGAFFYRRAA